MSAAFSFVRLRETETDSWQHAWFVAIEAAKPALCITHKPGAMLITDRLNSKLAAF